MKTYWITTWKLTKTIIPSRHHPSHSDVGSGCNLGLMAVCVCFWVVIDLYNLFVTLWPFVSVLFPWSADFLSSFISCCYYMLQPPSILGPVSRDSTSLRFVLLLGNLLWSSRLWCHNLKCPKSAVCRWVSESDPVELTCPLEEGPGVLKYFEGQARVLRAI